MSRKYGSVSVKKISPRMDEVPDDCGYLKRFKYNIDMNSNGIVGECIEWCQLNCEGRWGWYFENKGMYNPHYHNWEEQNSYMSFEKKTDATKFWLTVGVNNMNNRDA